MKDIILFADILGYQSFLENNSSLETAEKVIENLTTLPKSVHSAFLPRKDGELPSGMTKARDNLRYLVFSDTILVQIKGAGIDIAEEDEAWVFGILYATALFALMWKHGLPVRAAVHCGEVLIKEGCIAGRGVVEAYREVAGMEFSGVIFSEAARSEAERVAGTQETFRRFLAEVAPTYLCPMKNGVDARRRMLDWCAYYEKSFVGAYLPGEVASTFWSWGKEIPSSVDLKVSHTAKAIAFLLVHDQECRKQSGGRREFGDVS